MNFSLPTARFIARVPFFLFNNHNLRNAFVVQIAFPFLLMHGSTKKRYQFFLFGYYDNCKNHGNAIKILLRNGLI